MRHSCAAAAATALRRTNIQRSETETKDEEVIVTRHDGVMRITMNRPTRKNALTAAHMLTGNVVEEVEVRTKTGRPVPLVDIRIVDPEMKNVPYDGKSTG
jgi:acyl-CoA synthetase (AMP-forming)/AMP-acid ligase II